MAVGLGEVGEVRSMIYMTLPRPNRPCFWYSSLYLQDYQF